MSEQVYSGRVSSVIHKEDDFRILKVMLDEGSGLPMTVIGHFPAQNVVLGSWVAFAAKWVQHPQYGRQLSVTRSPVAVPEWSTDRVLSALSANGVGPQIRQQLSTFAICQTESLHNLLNSGDLSKSTLDVPTQEYVLARWKALRAHLDAMTFLSEAGVPAKVLSRVWSTLGDTLESKITEDPWVLVRVAGISFPEADEVARRLGVSMENPGRMEGAVLTAVQEVASEGHVYAATGQVVSTVQRLISGPETPASKIGVAIKSLIDSKQLVAKRDPETGAVALFEPWTSQMEEGCARILRERAESAVSTISQEFAEEELTKWSTGRQINLTETQRLAVIRALTQPVSVLTGLPGTGKTTSLQAAVSILKDASVPFLLVAPTGIAAKRLSSVTGSDAATIHRAFSAKGWSPEGEEREATYVGVIGKDSAPKTSGTSMQEQWGYGPDNPHPAQVVVVDESSMLDLHMLFRLLQGTLPTCRMVFVGDPYQLPSVGAGDVLRDIANSKMFPHTHLSEIFRQQGTSGIVIAAHDVHAGRTPKLDMPDFRLVPAYDESNAADLIRQIVRKLYDSDHKFQVLSPRHKGDAGVTALNDMLRLEFNPPQSGKAERGLAHSVVREGDRIMIVKNDYENGVYNGDVGKVHEINHKTKTLVVHVFGEPGQPRQEVRYNLSEGAPPIRLAYCQTVHKSQGQEHDIIVIPMLKSFGWQLQRNLLYTAITRAKRRVFIVGEVEAVSKAVLNNQADKRNTLLSARLRGLL